tara:strand:- start:211519 stop:211944 length:426 start_codon:yes stop_codon:yes gene_type:complete
MENTERQFIRHPTTVPILFNVGDGPETIETKDVGDGGLCFVSQYRIGTGEHIHITIPICTPKFEAHGIVRWCKQNGNAFLIGVAFQQESVIFALRMVEQVCHIENYRKKILAESGIELTSEQAANEWISHYANEFPQLLGK